MRGSVALWAGIAGFIVVFTIAMIATVWTGLPFHWSVLLFVLSFVPLVVGFLSIGAPEAELGDDSFSIRAPFVKLSVPYGSVNALELRTSFDAGWRVFGYGGFRRGLGEFSNKEFGSYTYAGSSSVKAFVVVRYDGKKVAVFNLDDEDSTRAFYEGIRSRTSTDAPVSDQGRASSDGSSHRRTVAISVGAVAVVVTAVLVAVVLMMGYGSVTASMDDDSVTVDAPMMHEDILYDDIVSVELRDGFDRGDRTWGFSGSEISSGEYSNEEFGSYRLAVYKDNSLCIVVHTADEAIVFNLQDGDSTRELYGALSDAVAAHGMTTSHAAGVLSMGGATPWNRGC